MQYGHGRNTTAEHDHWHVHTCVKLWTNMRRLTREEAKEIGRTCAEKVKRCEAKVTAKLEGTPDGVSRDSIASLSHGQLMSQYQDAHLVNDRPLPAFFKCILQLKGSKVCVVLLQALCALAALVPKRCGTESCRVWGLPCALLFGRLLGRQCGVAMRGKCHV